MRSEARQSSQVFRCRLAATLLALAAIFPPLVACAEKANVFFIHGANVSERHARAWASEMFKRLWQAGANMEFYPVAWESDIGPSYNYQVNVSNAFVTASRLAPYVNSIPGRRVVIAHSLGTMVAAAAIQDYGMQVEKLIMLNSAIPSEAFDPSLADATPENKLVHDSWTSYTNTCWTALWHRLFPSGDARSRLTWRGRFAAVVPIAVNFYSSGDEVLELYPNAHNPAWYNGLSPSGNWGDRYSWHKQEIWKGRKSLLGFIGTTEWSGWGFSCNALGVRTWSASDANAVADPSVFATNTVFNPYPESITNPCATRLETDSHLAQGIPALSPPTGRTNLWHKRIPSFDMNSAEFKVNAWPRPDDGRLGGRFLHSDVKNVAYFFVHLVFQKIVEVGGLKQ
ncbi:MAG: alpha/beta fold hydrolase [Kiritimatiellia bacterium]